MKHFLMMAALLAGTVCMAENLLVNGDMKNSKGWVAWGAKPADAKARAGILTYVNEGPNGERVLKLEDPFTDFSPYLNQFIEVGKPAGVYKLSCSLKAAAGKKVLVMLQMFGTDPATGKTTRFLGAREEVVSGTGDWRKCEFVFRGILSSTKILGMAFYPQEKSSDKSQTGSFLLTDVSLERLP